MAKGNSKGAGAGVPAVRKQGTAVVSMKELMEKQAAQIADKIGSPGGDRIAVSQDKSFKFPDGTITKDPFQAIIVEFVTGHFYYAGKYDPKNIVPPDCFALGEDPDAMVPSENSPQKQADNCQDCALNQFGSDGAGKACQNRRVLALLPPDALDKKEERGEDEPLAIISVSPTALRNFDGYVAKLANMAKKPPAAFITTIGFNSRVDYAQLVFTNPEIIEDEALLAHVFSRQDEARARLLTEPDVTARPAPTPKAQPRRGARR